MITQPMNRRSGSGIVLMPVTIDGTGALHSLSSTLSGGEGRGEEVLLSSTGNDTQKPLSPALSPLVPRGERESKRVSLSFLLSVRYGLFVGNCRRDAGSTLRHHSRAAAAAACSSQCVAFVCACAESVRSGVRAYVL